MIDKLITLNNIDLVKLFGANNQKLNKIKKKFPEIKIITRGEEMKLLGNKPDIIKFEKKLASLIKYLDEYNSLSINQIEMIIDSNDKEILKNKNDVILYGKNGKAIKAKTIGQRHIVSEIKKNDMLFVVGPAGTGKTYTSVALAVQALKQKKVKRIIFTRPAIEAGESLGFLPGDLKEKLDPYMQPIYDALFDMIPLAKLDHYLSKGIIQIAPLAFMRGRTLDDAFVILDEGQNTTDNQMKMFLTRMGMSAKFIITGDETQIDLPNNQRSGLVNAKKLFKKIKNISLIELNGRDVIRHKLVKQIINAYKNNKNDKNNK